MTAPDCPHTRFVDGMTGPCGECRPVDLEAIEARAGAATAGPWRSMRDGNQYLGTRYLPTATCVGASRVEGLPRPWNPHAVIARMQLDAAEVSRFVDADADFIAHARADVPAMARELRTLRAERDGLAAEVRRLTAVVAGEQPVQTEREFLVSDRAAVAEMLADLTPGSFNTFWMTDRIVEIDARLAELARRGGA